MANNEQDWPADPGPAEPAVTPAAPSAEDSAAGPAHSAPARARSVWADMLIPGPDDTGEPGPDDGTQPPVYGTAYGSLHEGTLGWPSSGLPPSFGQRPAVGERPDFGDPVPPEEGEVPVFWACGVTPQAVLMTVKPPLAITHAPGHMFIADTPECDIVGRPALA